MIVPIADADSVLRTVFPACNTVLLCWIVVLLMKATSDRDRKRDTRRDAYRDPPRDAERDRGQ